MANENDARSLKDMSNADNINIEIDQNIELFFYHPHYSRDSYIEKYKEYQKVRFKREGGYRYSPLFLCLKDTKYCLGALKEFNPIKAQLNPANFASIILVNIAIINVVKNAFNGDLQGFSKKYLGIENPEYLTALRWLRNAIEHSGYSLFTYDQGEKIYFGLGFYKEMVTKDTSWKRSYPSRRFFVNPRMLYSTFEKGVHDLKMDLLNHDNVKLRKYFKKKIDLDTWILIT